ERNRWSMHGGADRKANRLIELYRGRLDGRRRLLRNLFHTVGATRARRHSSVGEKLFAFVQGNPVTGPIDVAPNAKRKIDGSIQGEPQDPSVIVVKASIVSCDNRIMLRDPLQFLCILHSSGHDGIGINWPRAGRLRVVKQLI